MRDKFIPLLMITLICAIVLITIPKVQEAIVDRPVAVNTINK